jgi:transcriptional regulator with XRE-family HTH domain
MSFRRIILAEVERQGLSGYRLAAMSGIPMRSVQGYLAGDHDMQGERLARIAKALQLGAAPERAKAEGG